MTKTSGAPLSEKIGYGFGDMSSSLFWKIYTYFLPFFYTEVFGLKAQHAAFLLLITKIYDAVSDPVMGAIADRTSTKWGKYRPYLLWMAIPFAICAVLMFTTPDTSYLFKHIYAYVTYILMMTVYTGVNVPYGAMLGVVTSDPREKSVFSSFRMFFAYIGSFMGMGLFLLFEHKVVGSTRLVDGAEVVVKDVGDAAPAQWTHMMMIVGALCAIFFILTFLMTREHVHIDKKPKSEGGSSVGDDLKDLAHNGPWWLLLGASIGILIFSSIRGGAVPYYFSNILGSNAFLTFTLFLTIGEIAQMAGVPFAVAISGKIGKKGTFMSVLAVLTVLNLIAWFLPATKGGVWVLLILQILISFAIGVNSPMLWSMFADVADYSELKNGNAATGLIFSSSSMAQKFGSALGSYVLMQVIAFAGYDASLAAQPQSALTAIRALISWVPAIGSGLGFLCLWFYPLTTKRTKEIQSELAEKRR
jgi:GPH family glycoside/pentoside/hexuronide:cation symporter